MTKLVKVDSSIESSSREFAARLAEMLGSPAAENKPAVVRQKPTGPKFQFTYGLHSAYLYAVLVEKDILRRGTFIAFDLDIYGSDSMPVLGLVTHRVSMEGRAGPATVKNLLEAVGLLEQFLSSKGDDIECEKYVLVSCTERPTANNCKFMYVKWELSQ